MTKIKNQHFVPRFYLKHFADSNQRIWIFDKIKGNTFMASIEKIASENYFYDDQKIDSKYSKDQYIENLYSKIESEFALKFTEFIDRLSSNEQITLTKEEKENFAKYIVSQIDRTTKHREELNQFYKEQRNFLIDNKFSDDLITKFGYNNEDIESKELHLESIIEGLENIEFYAEMLLDHIWLILKNKTSQSFHTSDSPVALNSNIENEDGLISPGSEIAYPLTPNYLLLLLEREYFQSYEKNENKELIINDLNLIQFYNSLQEKSAKRQIYSAVKFKKSEQNCTQHQV